MGRITTLVIRAAAYGILLLAVSCGPGKVPPPAPIPDLPAVPSEILFPTPYFPARAAELLGRSTAEWAPGWIAACVYAESLLDIRQKAWVGTLEPAGGEGRVGLGFSGDFDGDGRSETAAYGAYAKGTGEEGNFILLFRENSGEPEVLLLKEIPGPPRFTVLTLKPDGSLWFGGGIDAGEVTMNVTWNQGTPAFHFLTEE